jgi:hypothetical protein
MRIDQLDLEFLWHQSFEMKMLRDLIATATTKVMR